MAHAWSNALNGAWYNGYDGANGVPGVDLSALDGLLTVLLNGDGGGTWVPTQPIQISGAGVGVLGLWRLGNTAYAASSVAKPFILGDNDFFTLAPGHTSSSRTIRSSCVDMLATITRTDPILINGVGWELFSEDGVQLTPTLGNTFDSPSGTQSFVPASLVVPIRVHNGATLASAVLAWVVGQVHANVPENLPKWRIVSISSTGKLTPLNTSFTGSYDSDGYLLMTPPTSGSNYYNAGTRYVPVYTCDAGVIIDTATNDYAVEIIDEWGPSAALMGNVYFDILASFTNILDMEFQT